MEIEITSLTMINDRPYIDLIMPVQQLQRIANPRGVYITIGCLHSLATHAERLEGRSATSCCIVRKVSMALTLDRM